MKRTRLTLSAERLHELLLYNEDTGLLTWKASGKTAGSITPKGYIRVGIDGKCFMAHRVIWVMKTGEDPPEQIDHKDRVGTNNRWINLREASQEVNQHNRGFTGVTKDFQTTTWRAQLMSFGKYVHLGRFQCFGKAVKARNKAKLELHPSNPDFDDLPGDE